MARYGQCPLCDEEWTGTRKVKVMPDGAWVHAECYEDAQLSPLARLVKRVSEKASQAATRSVVTSMPVSEQTPEQFVTSKED